MLRAYIVGYGYMGKIRAQVCIENKKIELVGICDTQNISANLKEVQVFDDFETGLYELSPNLVFICTPNFLIPKYAKKALSLGCHVFCEKPPGRNLQDVREIMEAEKKAKKAKVIFGFNHRYHLAMLDAKSIINSSELGSIIYLRGLYGKSGGRKKDFKKSWRESKSKSGGGILLDQGIHILDLFRFFLDNEIHDIQGLITSSYWNHESEDNAMLQFKSGKVIGSLHSSSTLWKHRLEIEVGMTKGYLKITGLLSKSGSYGREQLKIARKFRDEEEYRDAVGFPTEEIRYYDQDHSWGVQVDYWIKTILNDSPVKECGTLDAIKAMEIIEEVYNQN